MKFPLITRAKYDRQIAFARLWETCAKRTATELVAAETENAGLKALLSKAERKLERFERKRGAGGKFQKQPDSAFH